MHPNLDSVVTPFVRRYPRSPDDIRKEIERALKLTMAAVKQSRELLKRPIYPF